MISVVTAVCGLATTQQWFEETLECPPQEVVIAANGCTEDEGDELHALLSGLPEVWDKSLVTNPEPMGSGPALNLAASVAHGDVLALLHNDLMVRDFAWPHKVEEFFEQQPQAGVVGFAGAKRLGRDDIYRAPYELTQLARGDVWSSLEDWDAHGSQAAGPVEVAVLDGLAICISRSLFERLGGFDEGIGPHHMYDIDLSLRALEAGYRNYVLPIRCRHISGQTANAARYQAHFGPDADVHAEAHRRFYRKWLNKLPVRV